MNNRFSWEGEGEIELLLPDQNDHQVVLDFDPLQSRARGQWNVIEIFEMAKKQRELLHAMKRQREGR